LQSSALVLGFIAESCSKSVRPRLALCSRDALEAAAVRAEPERRPASGVGSSRIVRLATASLASWRERGDLKLTYKP
jgi:hypothetical protein